MATAQKEQKKALRQLPRTADTPMISAPMRFLA
jgi:hypothetical protein